MKCNPIIPFFFLILFTVSSLAQDEPVSAIINANNVKAVVNSNGALFWDFEKGQFIAPYQPGGQGISTMKASGIWLAGYDPSIDAIVGAIQLYNKNGKKDFVPAKDFNKIWKVTREEIIAHNLDFNDNGVIDHPIPSIYAWPGKGNPHFENFNPGLVLPDSPSGLAPFNEKACSGDDIYDPDDGDFPVVDIGSCYGFPIPNEMLWFSFNDNTTHTQSGMEALGIDIHCQVFAYQCEGNKAFNNSVFVRYKLINQYPEPLDITHLGIFADFDIGNPNDDFLGSDTARSIIFAYNGDEFDEGGYESNAPVMAVDFLIGPIDEFAEYVDLKYAQSVELDSNMQALEYYRLLSGLTPEGFPAANDGILYPGNPNDPGGFSEVTQGNTPGNRVVLASTESFRLDPGALNELVLAYTFYREPGNTPLENIESMYEKSEEIHETFNPCLGQFDCNILVPTLEKPVTPIVDIFPNPAWHYINIKSTEIGFKHLELIDLNGEILLRKIWNFPQRETQFSISDLSSGFYFVKMVLENGIIFRKKIIIGTSNG